MTDNILNDPFSLDTEIRPTWCPGCGNFSIWLSIKQAITSLNIAWQDLVMVYDVGCSGNMADFIKVYGFHALHGRAIPPAVGIKLANQDLKVIVVIGDGGGYGEGLTHFLNEMRGNHDITVLVHNNHRYSLTTGQMSPTTPQGTKTKSTPLGSIETELNPIALSLSNHATFVAREFAVDIKTLTQTIIKGINHTGFSVIDILQPCMVFNPEMDTKWYMEHIQKLDTVDHSADDLETAWKYATNTQKLFTGIFWQQQKPAYHQQNPTLKKGALVKHDISTIDITSLLQEFT